MTDYEIKEIWKKVLHLLANEISEVSLKTWIDPIEPIYGDDTSFVVVVPDSFSHSFVIKWQALISNALDIVTSRQLELKIEVKGSQEILAFLKKNTENLLENSAASLDASEINSTSTTSLSNSAKNFSILNHQYTFDSFVVGSSNRFAHAACVAVAEKLGGRNYNPLFLYGGSGLGKTHLMHAIGNYVSQKHPEKKIIYVQCEQFVNEFISAIKESSYDDFREKYRNPDLLLIDDIQFIEGKEQMQIEFFHTFNSLHESGKHIVMTCDKPPKSLASLEERLRTRFSSGLTVDIQAPDYETRVAILIRRANQNKVNVPEDVLDYIAANVATNIRELDGAFNTVLAYSLLAGTINIEVAASALKDIIQPFHQRQITPDIVMEVVSLYYNVTIPELLSSKRSKDITIPRQVAMYLCRFVLDLTFPKIGEVFGGKDHTTVMHACNKVTADLNSPNSTLTHDIYEIKKRLSAT